MQPYRVSDIDSSELWIVAQDTLDGLYEAFECHSKEILWLCALENTKLRMPVKGLEIMESREKQQQLENTDGTTNKLLCLRWIRKAPLNENSHMIMVEHIHPTKHPHLHQNIVKTLLKLWWIG